VGAGRRDRVGPAALRTTWGDQHSGTNVIAVYRRGAFLAGGESHVVLRLREPIPMPLRRGQPAEVDELHVSVDDPAGFGAVVAAVVAA
jgi:hypothetical protein